MNSEHVENPGVILNVVTAAKWLTAGVVGLYVSLPMTVQVLLLLMAADFLTGIIVAYREKKLDSQEAWRGFTIKILVLMLVGIAHAVAKPFDLPLDLGTWVAGAYAITELFSVVENCAKAGVPIPEVLIQAMVKIRPDQRTGDEVIKELESTREVHSKTVADGKTVIADSKIIVKEQIPPKS